MTTQELLERSKEFKPDEEYLRKLIKRLTDLSSKKPKQCSETEFLSRTYNL